MRSALITALGTAAPFVALAGAADDGPQFYVVNGQVYTPGLAIIDAPQPNTPEGGGSGNLM